MQELNIPTPLDNDPLKQQLLDTLQMINEQQMIIRKELESLKKHKSVRQNIKVADSPLQLFIHDEEQLAAFIYRLSICKTTREWAVHAVYPLYEDGYLLAEDACSKRFIEFTIPYCKNLKKKNYECLKKQIRKCYFPNKEKEKK